LRWPLAGVIAAGLTLALAGLVAWRTAQTAAIVGRGLDKVALGSGMVAVQGGPAHPPLIAPSLLRMYGLRSAIIFVLMILSLGASTFMLREATTGPVIGGTKGYAGDFGPGMEAWLDTPNGLVAAPNGDVYFADSNNDVIRRIDPRTNVITTIVGKHELGSGFSGDNGPAL